QDLGGAGLTCATSETASRGGVGMDVDATAVPRREPSMEPFEVMTSESQERMLAIVRPDDLDEVLALCTRWEVRATVVGRVTEGGRLRVLDGWEGAVLADVPAAALHEDAPLYDRPMAAPARVHSAPDPDALPAPRRGTAMLVAESTLNVACAGARPVALVNCLNFGNPEHPEVMWQLSEAIDGMTDACRALGLPVIGGNVSLYNESRGRDIDPTPVVGVLGLVDRLDRVPPGISLVDGGSLLLLGPAGERALGGSRWAALRGHRRGTLPLLDLALHRR